MSGHLPGSIGAPEQGGWTALPGRDTNQLQAKQCFSPRGAPNSLRPGECRTLNLPGYVKIYSNEQRGSIILRGTAEVAVGVNAYLYDPADPIFGRAARP